MKLNAALLPALGLFLCLASPASAGDPGALNQAAGLYHQARFDSARVRLESLLSGGEWRRRDSLVLLQYLGMAWSRLGRDSAATARFGDLLAVDSLFRLPRNEDEGILRNFRAALDQRTAQVTPAAPQPAAMTAPAPVAAGDTAAAGGADPQTQGSGTAASIRAAIPEAGSPLRDAPPSPRAMSFALGAVPLGGGWVARKHMGQGVSLGLIQAGGILLSIYASEMQSRAQNDFHGLQASERDSAIRWQWVQRVSLSTSIGAYLYSIIASGGD